MHANYHMSGGNEEPIQQLKPREAGAVQLVQITDCHIFAAPGEKLHGLDTRRSFESVKSVIGERHPDLDLTLATGDLSQDGSAESYRYLATQMDDFGVPAFWLPGNHDEIGAMSQNFVGRHIDAVRHVLAGSWQILLLDSTVPGAVTGCVAEPELEFMDQALNRFPDMPALVCLHHQAQPSGSRWLDEKGLDQAEQLRGRLAQHDQVRGVLWGHVHQESDRFIDGIQWMSTPSTCIQFKADSAEFAISDEAPGYRQLRLNADGSLHTEVIRVDHG